MLRTVDKLIAGQRLLVMVLAGLYVLSPVDVLPEAVLGPLGLPDDAIAFLVGLRALFSRRA